VCGGGGGAATAPGGGLAPVVVAAPHDRVSVRVVGGGWRWGAPTIEEVGRGDKGTGDGQR
jgi:hypothetical protein